MNGTTFKNLLLNKYQTSFKLVMDGDVVDTNVVEFIGELFNVGLFPGTVLTKLCIDELVNRRMKKKPTREWSFTSVRSVGDRWK